MPIVEVDQQTPEWLQMRCGMFTASRAADVITKLKKGDYRKSRQDYLWELVCERLTGRAEEHFVTPAMDWGTENEPWARAAYELAMDCEVEPGQFAIHPTIEYFGASPDGLVGDDGVIEIKCPNAGTHIGYLKAGVVPEEYKPQMLAQMACAERKWCDFISFDPRMPANLRFFCIRFERDEEKIAEIEAEAKKFLAEVAITIQELNALRGQK